MARSSATFVPIDPLRRFQAFVRQAANGCLEWSGHRNRKGYGRFWDGGRHVPAHRFAWSLKHGDLPPGTEIDHVCRNRACVNPDHLEAVTHHENILRGRDVRRPTCAAGHAWTPENTVRRGLAGRRCRECQNAYQRRWRRARASQLPAKARWAA